MPYPYFVEKLFSKNSRCGWRSRIIGFSFPKIHQSQVNFHENLNWCCYDVKKSLTDRQTNTNTVKVKHYSLAALHIRPSIKPESTSATRTLLCKTVACYIYCSTMYKINYFRRCCKCYLRSLHAGRWRSDGLWTCSVGAGRTGAILIIVKSCHDRLRCCTISTQSSTAISHPGAVNLQPAVTVLNASL